MAQKTHRLSIFSQSLDRAAFLAYLLGAVVPVVALAIVIQRFAIPEGSEGPWSHALIALLVSVGGLSVASFLALRRVTWRTIDRVELDKHRLEALLRTSEGLASAPHGSDVAATVAECALHLTGTDATFFVSVQGGGAPKLEAAAGATALFEALEPGLPDLLEQMLAEGRPTLWNAAPPADSSPDAPALGCTLVPVDQEGALIAASTGPIRGLEPSDLGSLSTLAALSSVALRNARLRDAQRNFFVHVTDLLVASLDVHVDAQAGHSRRVAELANRVARELELGEEQRQRLHFAALLHDVGMLRIESMRLADPRVHRQHPTHAYRMLAPIQLWEEIAPIVLHHHERADGSGYPEGLAGDEIPLESRIIGLAEAFDCMTSTASYQEPVERDEALRRIESGAGTQFDADVARVFLDLARRGEL